VSKVASKINNKMSTREGKKNTDSGKSKRIKIKVKSQKLAKPVRKLSRRLKKTTKKFQEKELIVIDEAQGLIFENEKTLLGYFATQVDDLQKKFDDNYNPKNDFSLDEMMEKEILLESVLDDPDEIWVDKETYPEIPIYALIKEIESSDIVFSYVAVVYLNSEEKYPTFVFVQFPTKDAELVDVFREKEIIYHRKLESIQFAAIDGDSLLEGDYLAIGLLEAMMKVRSDKDVAAEDFQKYAHFRDEVINEPDEIWRKVGSDGQVLVTFISDVSENSVPDMHYVVVTEEDPNSQVHSLLFSFPTTDESLLSRYRQGENLEADEVSTESSH
jgi:hypothetical protein